MSQAQEKPLHYIRNAYNVPAEIGRRVKVNGRDGIIFADRGNYIGVNFDSDKPGVIHNCHPTWQVEYLDMGTKRCLTQGQKRYQKYLDAKDWFHGTFAEWLGVDAATRTAKARMQKLGY